MSMIAELLFAHQSPYKSRQSSTPNVGVPAKCCPLHRGRVAQGLVALLVAAAGDEVGE